MKLWTICGIIISSAILAVQGGPGEHEKIVACYWGAWSVYRVGSGKFDVDNIDPDLCTHGFYGFAELSNQTWEMVPNDPWYDQAPTDPDCDEAHCNFDSYRRFVALKQKNPNFIPMISVGGWNSGSGRFSVMAADEAKKKTFLDSVLPFLNRYGFEGLDFDWEYPGAREGSDPDNDRDNFTKLIEELSALLKADGKLLSAAVSPNWKTVDTGYNVPEISKNFDFINVMCYDFHGWWPQVFTGHNAPLSPRPEDNIYEDHPGFRFNSFDAISYWINAGAPKEKLVMGMPIYGRGFMLNNTEENGLYCPAKDGIPAGPYTLQVGIWGFQEVKQAMNNDTLIGLPGAVAHNWTVVLDDCYHAPYAYNGPYWISYDDVDSFKTKAMVINHLELGGGMVWSIDTDDFLGEYEGVTFPMLRVVHDTFASGESLDPTNPSCKGTAPICDLFAPTTEATTTTTTVSTTTTPLNPAHPCTENNELIAFPGDCHKYFMCKQQDDQSFQVKEFSCGSFVFDPNANSCVDPDLPGNENLCN